MSPIKTNRTTAGIAAVSARAKDAAAQAVPMGKHAGTTAVQGVAGAKEWAAPRVQDAVRGAREWAAPRLDSAADAVTASVAPKVSAALHSTASQLRLDSSRQSGLRKLLDWRWLLGLGALLAAAGTTAAVAIRRRYASATADAEDATEPEAATQAQADDPAAEAASVNGQVTANKR